MNLSYFLAKRISFQHAGGFSGIIHRIAVASLAVGLGVAILSIMVLGGFQKTVSSRVYGFTGHFQVQKFQMSSSFEEQPFSMNGEFLKNRGKFPFLSKVQSYAHKAALLKGAAEVEGILLKGVGKDFDSLGFAQYLVEGKMLHLPDSGVSNEVLLSKLVANKLNISLGDKVTLYFVQQPPRYRRVQVVGIFETYLENFDEQVVIGELQTIRNLNGWTNDQVGGLELHVADPAQLDVYVPLLEEELDFDLRLMDSRARFLDIFDWLKLLDTNVVVFISLIGFVAIFNMGAILFLLIMERTQMIGLLKAMGAKNAQIQSLFFWNGIHILGKGLLYGNIFALVLGGLQDYFQLIPLDPVSYYMSYVPIDWNWMAFLLLNLGVTVLTALVLWIPVRIISRVDPIKSLRFN
ncbi:MAG: ABC transporter permease [Bacteroidetes bacterium]|nr:ABC transporter permease [Bacteroidota bacterium]MDA1269347.1 ABC transporter permease [Bacteroidota bacterium]